MGLSLVFGSNRNLLIQKSELVEKHPDWVLRSMNRELMCGRGGTQVVLDLCNPKVQDFCFQCSRWAIE